ncbi:hypothetical protein B0H13DRAFT_2337833 [Mycena leptocephala]|nr:hypothetical protein B0H13DRAFT_2337833 [Mycena leptocephala]
MLITTTVTLIVDDVERPATCNPDPPPTVYATAPPSNALAMAEEVWMYGGAGWYRDRGGRGGRSRGGLGQLRDTHRASKNLISTRSFSGNTGYLHNGDGARRSTSSRRSSPLPTPPSSSSYIVLVNEAVAAASQIIAYRPSCKQTSRRAAEGPHDSRSREYSVKATGLGNSGAFLVCRCFMHPTLS